MDIEVIISIGIAGIALIVSIISLIINLCGSIIINCIAIPNNQKSTSENKWISPYLIITNTYLKTISLHSFSVLNNNVEIASVQTRLYDNATENPLIEFLNLPPGESKRIIIKIPGTFTKESKVLFRYIYPKFPLNLIPTPF